MRLQDQVAVVTGSGRGIGRTTAIRLANEGARTVICSRTEEELEETASRIQAAGGSVLTVITDVRDPASIEALFDRTLDRFGRVDVLVNNAGVWLPGETADYPVEEWDTTMAINARGAFLCSQRAYPPMSIQDAGGSIVNISSIRGLEGYPRMAAYSASKFAMNGLTEALSREWYDDGIRVNAVCPGPVDTGYATGDPRNERRILPESIADLTAFLASDDAAHITGEAIVVSKQDFSYERYD